MTRQLTAKSRLETLKKEAKQWLKALRGNDAEARGRFERAHPRASIAPGLRDVQHALAREHGCSSWEALLEQLEDLLAASRSHAERVADFLDFACLHYGVAPGALEYTNYPDSPSRRSRALRLLQKHPEIASANLHTAVVCGNLSEVKRIVAERPDAATEKGGREGWEPLLFLCYGRLAIAEAAENTCEIARFLLDHGAGPNTHWHYLWDTQYMAWSALCGVIGDGEKGLLSCPPHPEAEALAELLLARGADPNQDQALYNTMLSGDDDRWLRLLFAHGLTPQHAISWDPKDRPNAIFDYLLYQAVDTNQRKRAKFLLEHGARPNPTRGRSLYELALLSGSLELAELLAQHGATRTELSGREAFRAACMRLDRETVRAMLSERPEYIQEAGLVLVDAGARDLVEVAELVLDLGVSPDFVNPDGGYGALHNAACHGVTRVAELLLARGAAVDPLDTGPRATPLGWAIHTQQAVTIELFSARSRDIIGLTAGGRLERVRELLEADRALANATLTESVGLGLQKGEPGETALFALPEDEDLALELVDLLLAFGADPTRRDRHGKTAAEKAHDRGLEDVAERLRAAGG